MIDRPGARQRSRECSGSVDHVPTVRLPPTSHLIGAVTMLTACLVGVADLLLALDDLSDTTGQRIV
jgi:hypothetical protein